MNSIKILTVLSLIFLPFSLFAQVLEDKLLSTEEIRIRDPYIYADEETQHYYMYAQIDNRLAGRGGENRPKGVEVYVSSDLKQWEQPKTVLLIPDDFWAKEMVWAPEMHEYNGKYYLFVTLTSSDLHENMQKPE